MKLNVRKITSVTILASMMLTSIPSSFYPAAVYGSEEPELMAETLQDLDGTPLEEEALLISETEQEGILYEDETPEKGVIIAETDDVEMEDTQEEPIPDLIPDPTPVQIQEENETVIIKEERPEDVEVKMTLLAPEAVPEGMDPKQAGNVQKIRTTVINPTDQAADLRLYFWDYDGTETDGRYIPKEALYIPCEEVSMDVPKEEPYLPVFFYGSDGNILEERILFEKEVQDDQLLYKYLEVELPSAGYLDMTFPFVNDNAEKVVISPVVTVGETEADSDRFLMKWTPVPEKEQEETAIEEMPEEEAKETVEEAMDSDTSIEEITDSGEEIPADTEEITTEAEEIPVETEEIPSYLQEKDFSSMRLLVLMKDEAALRDQDQVIGEYEDLYLIQYDTVKDCMSAYLYYMDHASAVEPDTDMEIATDETAEKVNEENPVAALSMTEGAVFSGKKHLIALLDTGAASSDNVVSRVSLIDDVLEGHTHGNQMVKAIIGQNPDAEILSIRVMGNDGRGPVSAIVSGMEYAMEHGATIINLSLSSRKNQVNAVLEAEIKKAASMGILVVGAAGNNAADVMDYMPGSIEEAYIIGACNENGVRITSSNYGATVDYNVVAGTTSEAAAKFSGYLSKVGVDGLVSNEGILFDTDYVAVLPEKDKEEKDPEVREDEDLTEEELNDMAGSEEEGPYPAKGSSITKTVTLWSRDTAYEHTSYNPYAEDENVIVECVREIPEDLLRSNEDVQAEYKCSLRDQEGYSWKLYVTFRFTGDRSLVSEGSSMLDLLMPENVNQERNLGYGGIVPSYMGETVVGRDFTVLKDDLEFDINGLLIDYNPETFKVNNLISDGGFDVTVPGTYTVTYEMSYFLYPDYTWFVENQVHVVEKESLEAGVYLTSSESTLMFRKEADVHASGYGDLQKVPSSETIYTISCVDEDYQVAFVSSSELISPDVCRMSDQEDGTKLLRISIPENLTETVILSMYRPGYHSAKFFTGGGWIDGEAHHMDEAAVDHLSDSDMQRFEDTVLGKLDENDEEYMEIAEDWTTIEEKYISGRVTTGYGNTTNNSWAVGKRSACNTATAQFAEKASAVESWLEGKGYNLEISSISNFSVNCASGHNYLGLWTYSTYYVSFSCKLQKLGDDYRLRVSCWFQPGSDQHGNYQAFYGSKTFSAVTTGTRLRVHKKFRDFGFMDWNPDRYGYLKTTFAIYPASAYNTKTGVLDMTVKPVSTIFLENEEESAVRGESDYLDPGTYYVVETRRIDGCTKNTDIYGPVVITPDDGEVVSLYSKVNNADYSSMASNNWIYNDPMYFRGNMLTKTDDVGLPVEGAIYQVEYSNAATAAEFKPLKTWYFKTDAKGVISYDYSHFVADAFTYNGKTYQSDPIIENAPKTLAMLPFGFVKLKEIMPPSDIYTIDTKTYTIELAAVKDEAGEWTIRKLQVKGNVPVSIDSKRYWKLKVEKESMADKDVLDLHAYSLQGASFGVFSNAECTKRVQLYSDEKCTAEVKDNVFKTDANGKTPEYYLKAPAATQTYYVKELIAPEGHKVAEKAVPVKVTIPEDATKLKTASFTKEYSEPYESMELDALIEKLSTHGEPVEGVVFKICFYDDSVINAAALKKTWYLVSDKDGKVYLDPKYVYSGDQPFVSDPFYTDPATKKVILPIGGLVTMQEISAPAQYVIDDTVYELKTTNQKVTATRIYNDVRSGRIRLKKYDQSGAKPLEGVHFEIAFVKAAGKTTELPEGMTRLLKEGETKEMITNSKGEITFDNLDLGTYEITEVKTVPGQTLLKDKIVVELPIAMTKEEAESYGNVDFSNAVDDTGYSGKWLFYDCLYEITNAPQFSVPRTGGVGNWIYGYAGLAVMAFVLGILMSGFKKKRSFE